MFSASFPELARLSRASPNSKRFSSGTYLTWLRGVLWVTDQISVCDHMEFEERTRGQNMCISY